MNPDFAMSSISYKRQARRCGARIGKGQTLIEALTGFIVIVPLGLMAVNLVAVVSTSQSNEQWAELAARAAAAQANEQNARRAAENSLSRAKLTAIIKSVTVSKVDYDLARGQVTIGTTMQVAMPVPMPFLSELECHADSIQPIVATPAPI